MESSQLKRAMRNFCRMKTGKSFEKVLITGGAKINSAFAKANLLDEIILNVEPVLVGRGIPLFAPQDFEIKMKLIFTEKTESGIVFLKYEIQKFVAK